MLKLTLKSLIRLKGIENPTQYFIKKGYSATYTRKLLREEVISISFNRLEEICMDFNCTPNDILEYVPGKSKAVPDDHALQTLRKTETIGEINKMLQELPMEKIKQLYAIMKEGNDG